MSQIFFNIAHFVFLVVNMCTEFFGHVFYFTF